MSQPKIQPPVVRCTTEHIDDCVRRMHIEISGKELKRFHKRCKKQNIASEEHISHALMHTLSTQTVPEELPNIFNQPRLIGQKAEFDFQSDLSLVLEIDVWPEIELPDMSEVEILMPSSEVTDTEVEAELLEQRRLIGTRSQQSGNMAIGDSATLLVSLQCAGDPGLIAQNETHQLTLIEHSMRVTVQGVQVDINPSDLIGKPAGLTIELSFAVPSNSPRVDLVGKTVQATICIEKVEQVEPASLDAVITEYEAPSEANFRMQVRSALQQVKLDQQQAVVRTQALAAVAELLPFKLPKFLFQKNLLELVGSLQKALLERGYQTEEAQRAALNDIRQQVEDQAARQLRTRLLTAALRDRHNIGLDQDLLAAEINRMAQVQGRRPVEIREELLQNQAMDGIRARIMVIAVADWIISQSTTRTVPTDVFEKEARSIPI